MVPVRGIVVAVLAILAAGAVPLGGFAQGADEPQVTDPEGDAREYNSEMFYDKARYDGCWTLGTTSWRACQDLSGAGVLPYRVDNEGGKPAPPAMDGLAAWFEETPTHLLVSLMVASLEPSLEGLAGEDPGRPYSGQYEVYWSLDESCSEYVELRAWPDGLIDATFGAYAACDDGTEQPWGGGCNAWWMCMFAVEHEIAYGMPAVVTWKVPRTLLLDGSEGATLVEPAFQTWRSEMWTVSASYRLRVQGVDPDVQTGANNDFHYPVDSADPGRPFTFALPMDEDAARADLVPPWMDTPGDTNTATGPRLEQPHVDILSVDVEETPETITLVVGVAEVDATETRKVTFYSEFGPPSGHVVVITAQPDPTGAWQPRAGYDMPDQDDDPTSLTSYSVAMRPQLDVVEGSPGVLRFVLDRTELPMIRAGEPVTVLSASLSSEDDRLLYHHSHDPPLWPTVDQTVAVDVVPYEKRGDGLLAPGYWFRHDTPSDAEAGIFRFTDTVGDSRLPPDADIDRTRAGQFDITYVDARDRAEGTLEFTIGIRDLSSVTVPPGYEAAYYALGLETDAGPFMVGFYKDTEDPAGSFLCASDTTVLSESPRDPTQAVWTTIDGLVTLTPEGHGAGSGDPGSFTFYVPRACIGLEADGDASFSRLVASSFLIQNLGGLSGAGQVKLADEAPADGPVAIPRAMDEAIAPAAWYAAPMGISNFWDMLGIGLAAIAMVVAGGVKLAHRRRDKHAVAEAKLAEDRDVYKAALVKAVARGTHDPDDDEVLQALRRRLGIGEREHALMLLEARAAAGLADGLDVGERFLGKYRIEKVLGEGGFARTFLARDEKLDRRVVLKVARWDDPKEAARALKEGRMLAKLEHANIVRIHDVEEVAGQVVLVLEHVRGGSLADVFARGPLTPAEALSVADDVLAGLEAAHAQGIIHRDVKPGNILVGANGRAKLADFGIARREAGAGTATGMSLEGSGAGTLAYMAPEQARGAAVDERSDLYSLGVVLYELLAGKPYLALKGLSEYDARKAILEDEPVLPIVGVPDAANEVLQRALAKDPGKRPRNAGQMRALLNVERPVVRRHGGGR